MVQRQRNQAIFGGSTLSIDGVSTKISCLFSEHKIFDASSTRQQVPSSPQTWIPSPSLSFKINVDAIAAVAIDWREELVFAGAMKVNTTFPLQAKAEAIKWALSLTPVMGNKCIIVESNCQYCVLLLNDLVVPPIEGSSPCGLT